MLLTALLVAHLLGPAASAQDAGQADGNADGGGSVREPPLAQELLDCRAVDCFQRAECNRRVLAALQRIRTTVADMPAYQSADVTRRHIAAQIARQERLRSFVAPECRPPKSACDGLPAPLAAPCQAMRRFAAAVESPPHIGLPLQWSRPPPFGRPITLDDVEQREWLRGRWDGWLYFDDNRAAPVWLRVTGLPTDPDNAYVTPETYVKVCSDHGLVLARIDAGVLQVPRREALAFGSRLLLWRAAPHHDDIEGIVLLEIEPGREIQTGQVWLARALTVAPSEDFRPTDYPCRDKEPILRRHQLWYPDQ